MTSDLEGDLVIRRAGEYSHAFLLRCWQEPDAGSSAETVWRFSITPITAQRVEKAFQDLESLMEYLAQVLAKEQE
jgi:hypothetical protein